jgi:hypothetical protein
MPCLIGKDLILCYNNIYKFKGYLFEWHDYFGCIPLTKKGELRRRNSKEYSNILNEFLNLSENEREKYLYES